MNKLLNILEVTWPYIGMVLTALVTHYLTIRIKLKEVDINRKYELKKVVSSLFDVLYYLRKLQVVSSPSKAGLPVAFRSSTVLILNLKVLNENCFIELEDSIKLLKKYDPISYHKLSGIGQRTDSIKRNFIFPFMDKTVPDKLNSKISETFLAEIIEEIELSLEYISKRVGFRFWLKVKKEIEVLSEDFKEGFEEEFWTEYYQVLSNILPDSITLPSLEKFKIIFDDPNNINEIHAITEIFNNLDISAFMKAFASAPIPSKEDFDSMFQDENSDLDN